MKHVYLTITFIVLGCATVSQNTETVQIDEVTNQECKIPSSFSPLDSMGVPLTENESTGIEIEETKIQIEILDAGLVSVHVQLELVNRGSVRAETSVGYLTRVPMGLRSPIRNLSVSDAKQEIELKTCSVESPRNFQRPFTDKASYASVSLEPGGTKKIAFSYLAQTRSSNKAATLFGYHDVFAQNWKNWSWPYTKSSIFQEIAETLNFTSGSFALGKSVKTTIELGVTQQKGELRGLSSEQNLTKIENKKVATWSFSAENIPKKLEFEYTEAADFDKEKSVFSKLAAERPDDLRAHIHLSDMYQVSGELEARIRVLEKLLSAWEKNASDQMLTKRNDVRAAAYVGLVRSLLKSGKTEDAKNAAKRGIELINRLEQESPGEAPIWTKQALLWLENMSQP